MHLPSLLPAALALATATTSASFTTTCQNCFLRDELGTLVCSCLNNSRQFVQTVLGLTQCFANNNGVLVPAKKSCTVDKLFASSQHSLFLTVGCVRSDGVVNTESFDINAGDAIGNDDGRLTCFGIEP